MGWFQNFVNNSPHLFGEDSDFSESDSEDEGNDEIEENQEAENDQFSSTDLNFVPISEYVLKRSKKVFQNLFQKKFFNKAFQKFFFRFEKHFKVVSALKSRKKFFLGQIGLQFFAS